MAAALVAVVAAAAAGEAAEGPAGKMPANRLQPADPAAAARDTNESSLWDEAEAEAEAQRKKRKPLPSQLPFPRRQRETDFARVNPPFLPSATPTAMIDRRGGGGGSESLLCYAVQTKIKNFTSGLDLI